jgi:flavodoxin I
MPVRIYFATTTGKTEDIATRLAELIGPSATVHDLDSLAKTDELAGDGEMICCVPTWNTGADSMRSGTTWDSHVEAIPDLQMAG